MSLRRTCPLSMMVMVFMAVLLCLGAVAEDAWPMWGRDAARSHTTPYGLEASLHLQWERQLPQPRRAWPWQMDDFEKLAFDASYEPIIADGRVYVASMTMDTVAAYDAATGAEQWRFFADGPVRMAPAVWEGRVYVASDDGYLHCLDAETGAPLWQFRGAPASRLALGNHRIISLWPARGGPVVHDGLVYFCAGLWPHEGVFVYALDATTADVIWVNSGNASEIYVDSKRYYSYGGVAPQGQLVVSGDYLLVPGGRTVPAAFDRHTGEFLYLRLPSSTTGKGAGGHRVFAHGDWFFNVRDTLETHIYAMEDGAQHSMTPISLATDRALFGIAPGREMLVAYTADFAPTDETPPQPEIVGQQQFLERGRIGADGRTPGGSDRMSSGALGKYYSLNRLWLHTVDGLHRLHIQAGTTLYGSSKDGKIYALDVSDLDADPRLIWTAQVSGPVFSMAAAEGRLFITTEEGRLYCFGPGKRKATIHAHETAPISATDAVWKEQADAVLNAAAMRDGFGIMFGIGSGRLLEALLAQSEAHITVFDPDPDNVARFREHYRQAGHYGVRVAIHEGDVFSVQLPPYIAGFIVSEDPEAAGYRDDPAFARALFHPLRPYGGAAYLPLTGATQTAFTAAVEGADLEQAVLANAADHVLLKRSGPLPGAGAWTHQYADAANTAFSPDKLAKTPLGISWFGNVANHKTLPRHLHGPIPQVVAGRMILLGVDHISARCVYTGRELWATELPLVGEYFTSLEHEAMPAPTYFPNHPGANFIGSPYASSADSIYLIHEDRCLRLDTATGAVRDTWEMPDWETLRQQERDPLTDAMHHSYGGQLQEGDQLRWGNIRYSGDWLVVAAYPHLFDDAQPGRENNWNATSSEFIVVMNRHNGAIHWVHQARYGFRHNAIAASSDKVFVIDNLSEEIQEILGRRGITPDTVPQVRALDLESGALLWAYDDEVFGTSLSYSEEHDVLVQSGHPGRRRALPDEPQDRLVALRGADGALLWADAYDQRRAPLGIHASRRQIIASTGERVVDMLDGVVQTDRNPITGEEEPWVWLGALRCGTQNYSEHLIAFRSGATGVADILNNSGTTQLSGFRPGCTNSLIVADGMLHAPDYTRSCSCSYQHQTSLGLVHTPDAEMWTLSHLPDPEPGAIRRIGVNFGAPGSRLAEKDDVLWVEHPPVGGPAPEVPLKVVANGAPELFRQHSTTIEPESASHRWVAASGVKNLERLELGGLFDGADAVYTVRLHFCEPDGLPGGQRVFDVFLQGKQVETALDVARETNGRRQGIVRSFSGIRLGGALQLELKPTNGSEHLPALSGVEVVLEG